MGFVRMAIPFTKSFFKELVKEKSENITKLSFNNQSFEKLKLTESFKENEIVVNGIYHDIIKIVIKNNVVEILCYIDNDESSFLDNINFIIKKSAKSSAEKVEHLDFDFIKIIPYLNQFKLCYHFKQVNYIHFSPYHVVNPQDYINSLLLPPERI